MPKDLPTRSPPSDDRVISRRTTTVATTHPQQSVKLEAADGFGLDDDAQLEEDFFNEEDVLLLSADGAAQEGLEFAMGNAASTDQSGAASGGAPAGGADAGHAAGGAVTPAPDNPGFARVQGVTAARADGQRTKPRGPPAPASQYEFLQVRTC